MGRRFRLTTSPPWNKSLRRTSNTLVTILESSGPERRKKSNGLLHSGTAPIVFPGTCNTETVSFHGCFEHTQSHGCVELFRFVGGWVIG